MWGESERERERERESSSSLGLFLGDQVHSLKLDERNQHQNGFFVYEQNDIVSF